MGPVYCSRNFRTKFNSLPHLFNVPINLSQFPSHFYEKNKNRTSPLMDSGKGSESGNSLFLLPDMFYPKDNGSYFR